MRQIVTGDTSAYKELFDRYYPSLLYFAQKILHHRADAEDIVQDSFVTLWNRRRTLSEEGNISALLYTIVRNNCLNRLKALRRQPEGPASTELIDYPAAVDNVSEAQVYYEESLRAVMQEIHALPDKYRRIIQLLFVEGKSYSEASILLNLPESTIRKQKQRSNA